VALLAVAFLVTVPSAVAQTTSPTAAPTTFPPGDEPFPVTYVAYLAALFFGGGLLLAVGSGLFSLALVEGLGPFDDWVYLVLPLLVVPLPMAVVVATRFTSYSNFFLNFTYAGAVVGAVVAGFLLRRRYR
jgi:hypothetical protein